MSDAWSAEVQRFYGDPDKLRAVERRHQAFVRAYRAVARIMDICPGSRVLDVGCGAGPLATALGEAVAAYHGIDVCREVIALARARNPRASFSVMDVTEYAGAARYDHAVALSVLEFCQDKTAALASIHRALRSGGRLYVEVRNADFGLWRAASALQRQPRAGGLRAAPEIEAHDFRDLRVVEWSGLLRAAGFAIDHCRRSIRPAWYGGIATVAKNGIIRLAALTLPLRRHYMVGFLCTKA